MQFARFFIRVHVGASIATVLFGGAIASAQSTGQARLTPLDTSQLQAAMKRHTEVFTGLEAVQRRTTAEKLTGKLEFVGLQLEKQLSPNDLAAIQSLGSLETQHLNDIRELQRSGNQRVCANRKGKSAATLVDEFDKVVERANKANERFYDQLLPNLSADAKEKVLSYINRPIANGTLVRTNNRAVAQEAPDVIVAYLNSYCTAPPAPPRPNSTVVDPDAPVGTIVR